MKVFIKILKIIAGIILGLVFSFATIVGLAYGLPSTYESIFFQSMSHLWLTAPIVAVWVFFMLWLLLLRKPSTKKFRADGTEHLPRSISELIDGIIDAMKYRRSVRAEVRQELADHFTDALADCDTEEEKQKAIKELIEEFGNVELLGKLLRRGKKRCRPVWRTMVARSFQLVGLCFLLLILYIGWFFTGKPVVSTNYMEIINQQVRPVADDNQNAWPFYKQAAEKYVIYETEDAEHRDQCIDISPRNPSILSEQDRQILLQWIEDNRESINLIRQGNQKPYYWRKYGTGDDCDEELTEEDLTQLIAVYIPHLNEFKKLTQLMCWQGLLNAEQGDFEKAFDNFLEVYSVGCQLRGQNTCFMEQLVAMGVEGRARETLLIVLTEYNQQINLHTLDSVRKRFNDMIENKDFTASFVAEKLFMYDEAQRCFTQSRFGKSHLYFPRIRSFTNLDLDFIGANGFHIMFTHPDKDQTLKEVERFYSEMEKMAAMTPASVKIQGLDIDEIPLEVMKKNIFLEILMPALIKVNQLAWRVRAQAHGALIIMAVLQYEKEHGQLPDSLGVLVDKGLLGKVPIDPFSDKPLVYRKTDDDFILYSVGFNFTDDGGTLGTNRKGKTYSWRENGDGILWPMDKEE